MRGPLTEAEEIRYTRGSCHLLATLLHREGVGEPWAVASETSLATWEHMFVRVGPLCLDATGLQKPRALLRSWRPFVPQAVLVKQHPLMLQGFEEYVTEQDREVAERLLTWWRSL